ncbi:hypothetical protein BKA93DRAFT_202906 [Sparassis latifolia]
MTSRSPASLIRGLAFRYLYRCLRSDTGLSGSATDGLAPSDVRSLVFGYSGVTTRYSTQTGECVEQMQCKCKAGDGMSIEPAGRNPIDPLLFGARQFKIVSRLVLGAVKLRMSISLSLAYDSYDRMRLQRCAWVLSLLSTPKDVARLTGRSGSSGSWARNGAIRRRPGRNHNTCHIWGRVVPKR